MRSLNLNFRTAENSIKTLIVIFILVTGVMATAHEILNNTIY